MPEPIEEAPAEVAPIEMAAPVKKKLGRPRKVVAPAPEALPPVDEHEEHEEHDESAETDA
jgi:hypothetical protein